MNTNQDLSLSIVITSYTTERLHDIYELLESIKNQTYKNMETVYVIERSEELKDEINTFILEKSIPNIQVVFCSEKLGICAARNLGIRHAKGSIVAFTDDDAVLPPEWAEEILNTFDDEMIIGATGPATPLWENTPVPWFPQEFYWMLGCTDWVENDKRQPIRGAFGVNMSFRKEAFETCRFSENLGISEGANRSGKVGLLVDDLEFSLRVRHATKKTIIYNPKLKVQHKVYEYRLTRQFIRKQAYWQGYSKAILKKFYGKGSQKEQLIRTEYRMLRRILFKLVPSTLKKSLSQPTRAWKTLKVIMFVLYHVSIGYVSGSMSLIGTLTRESYST